MSQILNIDRKKYIKELQDILENTEKNLNEIVSLLGWDYNKLGTSGETYFECPFDTGHRVPEKSFLKHLEECEWKNLGYSDKDLSLPECFLPENSSSTIKIDAELQQQILQTAKKENPMLKIGLEERLPPKTSNRLECDFTTDERRIIYDYAIANTTKIDIGKDISDMSNKKKLDKNSSEITMLQLLAQERDLKRRRKKHKGVHTNKKSQTEILKEVIEQQMEMYKEYIEDNKYIDSKTSNNYSKKDNNHYSYDNFNSKNSKDVKIPDKHEKLKDRNDSSPSRDLYNREEYSNRYNSDQERSIERKRKRHSSESSKYPHSPNSIDKKYSHKKEYKNDDHKHKKHKKHKKNDSTYDSKKHKKSKHKHKHRSRSKS